MNIRQYIVAVFLLCLTTLVAQKAEAVPYAYATDYYYNTAVKIDTATNTVLSSIPVGTFPAMIAITPDGRYAYVVNDSDRTISKITLATEAVGSPFLAGPEPAYLAITPDGKSVYVTDFTKNNVYKIDTSTDLVTATIPIASTASGIAITPDGNAYVVLDNNTVSKIDTTTDLVVASIHVGAIGGLPSSIAITLDGTAAYMTNPGDSSISKIDTATDSVVHTISSLPGSPTGIAITPDGSYIYVTYTEKGFVSKIDTSTDSITQINTSFPTLPKEYSVIITPDGTKTYVTSFGPDVDPTFTVYVIENDVASPISGGPVQGIGIAITPDEAPTASFVATPVQAGLPSSFDGSDSSTPVGTTIICYAWNFGDGSKGITKTSQSTHTYTQPGTFMVTLTVVSSRGSYGTLQTPITIPASPSSLLKPPSHFKGHRLKNKHSIRLKWKKRPNQSVAQYKITRNKHKTFFVPALDKPRFTDYHRKTYKRYLYSIKAVDATGNKSHAKWTHVNKPDFDT